MNHVPVHTCIHACKHVGYLCVRVFSSICFMLAIQRIFAIPHRRLGTALPQMLLAPSEHSYSSFVGFPQGVFFLLFNQGLDPMLRGLFSCEKRPCRPWLTTSILNRVKCSLTNELCSHTNGTGY